MSAEKKSDTQMDKKKKAFIQEQIVPERNQRMKKGLLVAAAVIFCGVLFGLAASITMSVTNNYFDEMKEKQDDSEVSLETDNEEANLEDEALDEDRKSEDAESLKDDKKEPETIIIEKEMTLDSIEEVCTLLRKTAKQYNACIVMVSGLTQGVDWFDNPSKMEEASFGAILAEDTQRLYILTNYDSVQDVESIQVTFADNTIANAKLRGKDKVTNLAVLSVAKEELSEETLAYILVAKLGESYSLTEGSFVMALGSPNGYLYSVDYGVISGPKRDEAMLDGKLELFHTSMGHYSAGEGIVMDIEGKIIGLITHTCDNEDNGELNTMIGISRLKRIIEKMMNKQELVHFGVIASDIPEENKDKLGVENGIYITEVEGNSPALEAGIRVGDTIVEVDGARVSSIIGFHNILMDYKPKTEIKVKIVRSSSSNQEEQELSLVLGKR